MPDKQDNFKDQLLQDLTTFRRKMKMKGQQEITRRAAQKNPTTPASQSASLGTQLKCIYANARSMRNKEEELEMYICLKGHDLIGIIEIWWVSSSDWSVGMEG